MKECYGQCQMVGLKVCHLAQNVTLVSEEIVPHPIKQNMLNVNETKQITEHNNEWEHMITRTHSAIPLPFSVCLAYKIGHIWENGNRWYLRDREE